MSNQSHKHDTLLRSSRCPKFLTFSRCTRSGSHIMGRWLRNHILQLYLTSLALENFFAKSVQPHGISLGMRVLRVFWRKTEMLVEDECHCHRLMSRLPSQLLPELWSALLMVLWKKGCLRAAARVRRFVGSYSSMASIRSNSWWCSSASERRYLYLIKNTVWEHWHLTTQIYIHIKKVIYVLHVRKLKYEVPKLSVTYP